MSETSSGLVGQADQAIPFPLVVNEYRRHRYMADVMALHKQGIKDLEASYHRRTIEQRKAVVKVSAVDKDQDQAPCSSASE